MIELKHPQDLARLRRLALEAQGPVADTSLWTRVAWSTKSH